MKHRDRADAVDRAVSAHRRRWGEPDHVTRAPGRVNLIGEHTDYNDGYCLPMALPFDTVVAVSTHDRPVVEVHSEGFGHVEIDPHDRTRPVEQWALHLAGTVWLLDETGIDAGGWRATIATDVPTGASLSSSASLEVAVARSVLDRHQLSWAPIEVARLGQRVENEVIGLPSGIMDQFISAGAVEGHAGLLDCRALTLDPVPLPGQLRIAVLDTGTRRRLADAAYGDRQAACARAATELGVTALRDAAVADVDALPDHLAETRRRARHVVTENDRTLAAADALRADDVAALGALFAASHASLRDDYGVSSPALDHIVDVAAAAPGCHGARLTGGGFAGCAVAAVDADAVDAFTSAVERGYHHGDHRARVWICEAAAGAGSLTAS